MESNSTKINASHLRDLIQTHNPFPCCSLTSPQQKYAKAYANTTGQLQQKCKELSQQLKNQNGKLSRAIREGQ